MFSSDDPFEGHEDEISAPPVDTSKVKQIFVDPEVVRQIQLEIQQTGLSPISSAPDPKHPNANKPPEGKNFTMEDIPIGPGSKAPDESGKKKTTPKSFCCGAQEQDSTVKEEQVKNDPISKYSIKNGTKELLPPMEEEDKDKITLCLDLDETLIHSSFIAIPNADFALQLGYETNQMCVYVCVRPGCEHFLHELKKKYELVLFTASTQFYADLVVNQIDPDGCIKYRLYRESCSDIGGCHVKDLSRLGRNLDRTIIVDNSSVAYLLHPYNAIACTSWYDDKKDTELYSILALLMKCYRLRSVYDVLADI